MTTLEKIINLNIGIEILRSGKCPFCEGGVVIGETLVICIAACGPIYQRDQAGGSKS